MCGAKCVVTSTHKNCGSTGRRSRWTLQNCRCPRVRSFRGNAPHLPATSAAERNDKYLSLTRSNALNRSPRRTQTARQRPRIYFSNRFLHQPEIRRVRAGLRGRFGGGSPSIGSSFTRGSLMTLRTYSVTDAKVSPGNRRKLTTARAWLGITLSFVPASIMVAAAVVRKVALVSG